MRYAIALTGRQINTSSALTWQRKEVNTAAIWGVTTDGVWIGDWIYCTHVLKS
jgi:hypothetical protein